MTVYVDDMRAPFGRMIMCHMVANDEEELHNMARKLGLLLKWHQGDHYDLSLSRRSVAVELGAVEITQIETLGITRPEFRPRIENVLAERQPPKIPVWLKTVDPDTLTRQAELFHNDRHKR